MATPGTPAEVLRLWQSAAGYQLTAEHKRRFRHRWEVHELCDIDLASVKLAFAQELKLGRALEIARRLDEGSPVTRPAGGHGPKPPPPQGGALPIPRGRRGFRAPEVDFHPDRLCPSCGRPEAVCICA
jgi:hypothetical protein